jgi:hypothetical protein
MQAIIVALLSLCLAATAALAQEPPAPAPAPAPAAAAAQCWEVVAPRQGVAPAAVLKLNRCTGETWLLVRMLLTEAKAPGIDATYTFRWQRLRQVDTGEAMLATRAGPP